MTVAARFLPTVRLARRRVHPLFRTLPGVAGLLVVVLAVTILLGWLTGLHVLTQFVPGQPLTKVNAAVALLLLGAALVVSQGGRRDRSRLAITMLLPSIAMVIAALTLGQWWFGMDLGIDQALFVDRSADMGTPGRMAPTSAVGLILLSAAILLIAQGDPSPRLRQVLGALAVLAPLFFLVAMTRGFGSPFADARLTATAIPGALAYLVAGIGVLAAGARPSPFAVIVAPGSTGHMVRWLLVACVLGPVILGLIAGQGEAIGLLRDEVGEAFLIASMVLVGTVAVLVVGNRTHDRSAETARASVALRASEERNRLLLASLPQFVLFKDREGRFLSVNDRFATDLGRPREEIIGRTDFDLYPAELASAYRQADLDVMRSGRSMTIEEANVAGGERRLVESIKAPVVGDDGEVQGILCLFTDISERRHSEESRALLASIVTSADDAIVSLTADGTVSSWNHGAERLFGTTAAEAVGRPVHSVMTADGTEAIAGLLDRAREGEQVERQEMLLSPEGAAPVDVSMSVSPIRDSTGGHLGASFIARDVSEQRRSHEALEQAKTELERSNRELQEFASVASHDLQEPLRKVRAFADRLSNRERERLEAESVADLERIHDAAGRMERLIRDLLDYARVTSRARPFEQVDLHSAADAVVDDLATTLEATAGRVEIGRLPSIDADASQMQQLLQNLIANGLKFHREGVPPLVRVSAAVLPGPTRADTTLALEVSDNGIGFEPRYADRIFAPFERLHGRTAYGGTGIGLAICHKIAERHGGSIVAEGRPGEGATFRVTLPLHHTAPAAALREGSRS